MNQAAHQGYLLLADISGYTSYLTGTEITHAQEVLAELLELILEQFEPALILDKLEGDAVFAYASEKRLARGEALLEIIEKTYTVFRDRVESIRRRTTCRCNACRSIPNLDLKFITHYGQYLHQDVSGRSELVGTDVILAHRLLKNRVSEATGWNAYSLLTGAAVTKLALPFENFHKMIEEYESLGEVETYSLDLRQRYNQMVEARRVFLTAEEADLDYTVNVNAPPIMVWDWMNDIQKRLIWESYDDIRPVNRPGGRMGPGARNHCAHGDSVVNETVVDWRPFDYFTMEYPMGLQTRHLEQIEGGTRLSVRLSFKMRLPGWIKRQIGKFMFKRYKLADQYAAMSSLVEKEAAELFTGRES